MSGPSGERVEFNQIASGSNAALNMKKASDRFRSLAD